MSLDSCVRYFVIFDKFLSWFNDDLQMSETCTSNNMLSSSTTSRLLALVVVVSFSLPYWSSWKEDEYGTSSKQA